MRILILLLGFFFFIFSFYTLFGPFFSETNSAGRQSGNNGWPGPGGPPRGIFLFMVEISCTAHLKSDENFEIIAISRWGWSASS